MADKKSSNKNTSDESQNVEMEIKSGSGKESLDKMLRINASLCEMMDPILQISAGELDDNARKHFHAQTEAILDPYKLNDPENECSSNGSDIGSDCNTYKKSKSALELTYYTDKVSANSALETAISNWKTATKTYEQAVESAELDLDLAIATAKATFDAAYNKDSKARIEYLTATLKVSSVTAQQAYETAVEAAGTTLAGAAGTLVAAYATFVTSTLNAPLTEMNTQAAAEQTFWKSVETKRDS